MFPDQITNRINYIRPLPSAVAEEQSSLLPFKILRSKLLYVFHPDQSPFRFEHGSVESTMQAQILHFIQNQEYSISGGAFGKLQLIQSALSSQLSDTQTLIQVQKIIVEPLIPPRLAAINQNLSDVTQNIETFISRHTTMPLINNIKSLIPILSLTGRISYLHPNHMATLEDLVLAVDFRIQMTNLVDNKIQSNNSVSIQELQNCLLALVEFAYLEAFLIMHDPKITVLLNNFRLNRIFLNTDDQALPSSTAPAASSVGFAKIIGD